MTTVLMPMTHNIAFLSFLYFVQGIPNGLQTRFLPIYFRSHGMSLSNVGYFHLLFLPWMLKAFWAPLVDHIGTKKSWLTWSMLGLAGTCLISSFSGPDHLIQLTAILFLFNVLTSTQDIAVDALAILILTSTELSHGNIAQVVAYKFGSLCGGGLLTWLSGYFSWTLLFQFLALVYLTAVAITVFFVPVKPRQGMTIVIADPQKDTKKSLIKNNHVSNSDKTDLVDSYTRYETSLNHPERNITDSDKTDFLESYNRCATCLEHREANGWGLWWLKNHFSLLMRPEGTAWTMCYVLVYKLGEQGSLSMIPLYLVDQKMSTSVVGFWTGIVGLIVSMSGSFLGGWVIPVYRWRPVKMLWMVSILRTGIISIISVIVVIATKSEQSSFSSVYNFVTVSSMLVLLFFSGVTTTVTFTLMMQCSQRAPLSMQASHYSTLATMEVVGKLTFTSFTGKIADVMGYQFVFSLFSMLSAVVIPLFMYSPPVLWKEEIQNKNS